MIIHHTKTEFEWHRKHARLINMHMKYPVCVAVADATNATLEVLINGALFILVCPPLNR